MGKSYYLYLACIIHHYIITPRLCLLSVPVLDLLSLICQQFPAKWSWLTCRCRALVASELGLCSGVRRSGFARWNYFDLSSLLVVACVYSVQSCGALRESLSQLGHQRRVRWHGVTWHGHLLLLLLVVVASLVFLDITRPRFSQNGRKTSWQRRVVSTQTSSSLSLNKLTDRNGN